MTALGQSELRIAIEALSTGHSTSKIMKQHKRTAFREAVHQDKVNSVTKEIAVLQDAITKSGEIKKLQNEVRQLQDADASASGGSGRLAELQAELAQSIEQANTRAENLRGSYIDTLAGLYEDVSSGEDPLTLPASRYREDQAQGPGPLSQMETADVHNPPDNLSWLKPREQGTKKTVSFDKAYTREDPAAAGPDQTQLWEFAESKDLLTMEQVETALAQADMDKPARPVIVATGKESVQKPE